MEDRIEFIVGDFFDIIPQCVTADVVFLSPPWGGPQYLNADVYDIQSMIPLGEPIFCFRISPTNDNHLSQSAHVSPDKVDTKQKIT